MFRRRGVYDKGRFDRLDPRGGGNQIRLFASAPGALVNPYPVRGFDKFSHGPFTPQPRSDMSKSATQNFAKLAKSPNNRKLIRDTVLSVHGGAVTDSVVQQILELAISWYRDGFMEQTYGPSTSAEVQRAVGLINRWAVNEIGRQYVSQRAASSQWIRSMHRPFGMDQGMPQLDDDFDSTIDMHYN